MIPNGWEKTTLEGLIEIQHGFAFKSEYFTDSGQYVLMTPGNFYEDGGFRDQGPKTKYYSGDIPSEYLLKKGDILIAMTEQAEGLLGSTARVPESEKYLHNQRLGLIKIKKPQRINLDFLYWLYNFEAIRSQISEQASGTKVKHTSPGRLTGITALLPTINEQEKIAKILSTWDQAIVTIERLLENSIQQRNALMQQLLTGKTRFAGFFGEWQKITLGNLVKEVKRPVIWDNNAEYKLLSVKRRSEGVVLREALFGHQILTKKMNLAHAGDFLISKMQVVHGAMGLVSIQHHAHHVSDSYICLVAKDESRINIEFFAWYCKQKIMYHKAYLCSYGVHIEKMTFNLTLFLKEKIEVPPSIGEQQKIASALSAADQEVAVFHQRLASLKQEKKALMQQLLTGKRRVKVDDPEIA